MIRSVDEIMQTLVRASVDRKHPWRVVGFSTATAEGPSSRSVILRKVFPTRRQLIFFTDSRSEKLKDLLYCKRVSLLFWNPQHNLQLRLSGIAETEQDAGIVESYWQSVPDHARRDYGSTDAPGAVLADDRSGTYDLALARQHFVVLNVCADSLDSLELAREAHVRQRFEWDDAQQCWLHVRLVP